VTKPRAIFFGTPQFAVGCLDATAKHADVVAVVTQPDKPQGRGLALTPPPVKVRAQELGITNVMQPTKVRVPEFAEALRACDADIAIVVAYGRILVPAVLTATRLGCVNVHASLLPRHRGAAPIQWSILSGDAETGVCLMQLDEGLDTGPVLARAATPIGETETSGELFERLAVLGATLLDQKLPALLEGALLAEKQDDALATHAPMLEKDHGRIDWGKTAHELDRLVRGVSPWPGAFTTLGGKTLKVHRAHVVPVAGAPGEILTASAKSGLVVACGEGALVLDEVQPEGKRRMSTADYLAGAKLVAGTKLGES
jgi:methionyl-tRNA formyltransferase